MKNALRARLNLQDEHGYVSKAYMEFIKSIFIETYNYSVIGQYQTLDLQTQSWYGAAYEQQT